MKTAVSLVCLFLLIVACVSMIVCFVRQDRREKKMRAVYTDVFGHEPDPITSDKWRRNQKTFSEYMNRVIESQMLCKEETIIMTGLCRNNGLKSIQFWIPVLEHIGGFFKDYRILILENDSTDDTRKLLLSESRRNPRILVLCDDDTPLNTELCVMGMTSDVSVGGRKDERHLERRLEILAYLREMYLKRILRKWGRYTYMMVIDWDLIGELSIEGFFDSLGHIRQGDTDAVAVNSYYTNGKRQWRFFDTYPLLADHSCVDIYRDKKKLDRDAEKRMRKQLMPASRIEPLEVSSAFGGVCLYSMKALSETNAHYVYDGSYDSDIQLCKRQCEHSKLNERLRVVINPLFVFLIKENLH